MKMLSSYTTEIQIRFSDLDAYNHVNNAVYLSYMEVSRLPLVGETFIEHMKENIQYLLTKSEVNYLKPITQKDKVLVSCRFSEVTGARFKISYKIHDGEDIIYATGFTQHALFDAVRLKPVRIPAEWKKLVTEIE